MHDCATDEDAAFKSEFGCAVGIPRDRGDELMAGRHRFGARVHEHETAGAICILGQSAVKAVLAEERGLLITGNSSDRNLAIKNTGSRVAINSAGGPNLGKDLSRCADCGEQFVIPGLAVQIEEHRARGITGVGDMQAAASQIPDEPGIDGAEGQFATLSFFASAGDMIEQPANFASGKVSVDDKAGFIFYQFRLSGFFQAFAKIGGTPVLPDDGIVDGPARFAVPDYGCFALIGDAESSDVFAGKFGFGQNVASDFELGVPNLAWVMLDPAGLGEDLLEFLLRDRMNLAALAEQDGAGTGCPLIEG